MDNNPIQQIEKTSELSVSNSNRSGGFERFFVDTTNVLGVFPISIIGSYLFTSCLASILSGQLVFSGAIVSVILTSCAVSIFIWFTLSWFRWPLASKLSLAIWSSITAGLLSLIQVLYVLNMPTGEITWANSASCFFSLFTNGYVLNTYVIPSFTASMAALVPYLYREHLNKNELITSSDASNVIVTEKTIGTKN